MILADSGIVVIDLGAAEICIAAALILINAAISVALKLNLERRLLIASLRTVIQLLLIGFVLEWIFETTRWYLVALILLTMSLIAGFAAVSRTSRRFAGIRLSSVIAVTTSSWLITAIALTSIIRPERWYQPQYCIPLLGMILGNSLNGISLGLDRLTAELADRRDRVELLLTLGATRWEAANAPIREAVRTGMIPIINSMMVVGLVSLPGMMTGQLLAGALPLGAVRYQIVIMFLIAAATALSTVLAVLLSYRKLFNSKHQFLYHEISRRSD